MKNLQEFHKNILKSLKIENFRDCPDAAKRAAQLIENDFAVVSAIRAMDHNQNGVWAVARAATENKLEQTILCCAIYSEPIGINAVQSRAIRLRYALREGEWEGLLYHLIETKGLSHLFFSEEDFNSKSWVDLFGEKGSYLSTLTKGVVIGQGAGPYLLYSK